ncbi:MAG: DAK2 domain-containing protein, partial [Clostridia bacterium]|nr:DAK2 domain-containing protein [Clostridia bacterium]
MNTKRIDGTLFQQMMEGALRRMLAAERELNALNVFPVADGDTGTNMRLTLQNAMRMSPANIKLCKYLKDLSNGMLLSARGNSGVILSQFFKGIYLELARCSAATTEDLRNALVRAYKVAYHAVINPVEGTMLTVARDGIEGVKGYITRNMPPDRLLIMYIAEMRQVLERTPDMLPVLKESGVIDSGGLGWITLTRGMLEVLTGEKLPEIPIQHHEEISAPDFSLFTESSHFIDGYCTEFILQRLHDSAYLQDFNLESFIQMMNTLGTSLVVVEQESRVKVHIHTLNPSPVIDLARKYGEFWTFKLENMQVQHNQKDHDTTDTASPLNAAYKNIIRPNQASHDTGERCPLATIAVSAGNGLGDIYLEQGCSLTLDGGPTMSVSAREFLEAIERTNADHIVLLPNSSNVILAAEQARGLCKQDGKSVHVIPTRSSVEGYFALSMDDQNDPDPIHRLERIKNGAKGVTTLTIARAARDFSHDGRRWLKGERVAFINENPVAAGKELKDLLNDTLHAVQDLSEKEICIVFQGLPADEQESTVIEEVIAKELPMADFAIMNGGMAAIEWMIGLL